MKQTKPKLRYFSYLLRLWESEEEGVIVWRAVLEYPASGQRRGFASLAALFAFLEAETAVTEQDHAAGAADSELRSA
jgi:hypothetical protein